VTYICAAALPKQALISYLFALALPLFFVLFCVFSMFLNKGSSNTNKLSKIHRGSSTKIFVFLFLVLFLPLCSICLIAFLGVSQQGEFKNVIKQIGNFPYLQYVLTYFRHPFLCFTAPLERAAGPPKQQQQQKKRRTCGVFELLIPKNGQKKGHCFFPQLFCKGLLTCKFQIIFYGLDLNSSC
jgi:hypothetical protein